MNFASIAGRKEQEENAVLNAITGFAELVKRLSKKAFVLFLNITITVIANFA